MVNKVYRETRASKRAYYRQCPICGANLDPGERCDCEARESAPARKVQGGGAAMQKKSRHSSRSDREGRGNCNNEASLMQIERGGKVIMIPALERFLDNLDKVWAHAPNLDRESIDKATRGKMLLGIYPLYSQTAQLEYIHTGFAAVLWDMDTYELSTIDIEADVEEPLKPCGITLMKDVVLPDPMTQWIDKPIPRNKDGADAKGGGDGEGN